MSLEHMGKIQVQQLMEEPVIVSPSANISSVIAAMRSKDSYEVFIEAKGKTGIISVRDLLRAKDIMATKPAAVMKYAPNLASSNTVSQAADLMTRYRLRALPIVEASRLKGQISAASIIKAMREHGVKKMKVSSIMTPHPITIFKKDLVTKARSIMLRRRIDHLPVKEDNRLFGIVSSSMIVNRLVPTIGVKRGDFGVESRSRLDFPVDRIADKEVLTCSVNEDVSSIIEKMAIGKTCIIATLWDEIQGIVTQRDVIKLLAWKPAKETPIYMIGLPDDPFEAEAAREKFSRTVALLKKSFQSIEEASSIIETSHVGGERRRYEVRVSLKTPYKTFSFIQDGWELPQIYDVLTNRMKRILTKKPSKRKEGSARTFGLPHVEPP